MFNFDYLKQLLFISIPLSTVTCLFIQKTKGFLKSSKFISLYSFIVNMIVGILFSISFTSVSLPNSLWIGFFSFLGADTIYKSLEGKISSYSDILEERNTIRISKDNIINQEVEDGKTNIS